MNSSHCHDLDNKWDIAIFVGSESTTLVMRMASAMTKALETQNTHKRGGKKKKKNPKKKI